VPNPFPDLSSGSQEFTGMGVDRHREIQELIDVLKRNNLAELEYERDGFRIYVKREAGPGQAAAARDSVPAGLERHAERLADSGPADTVGKVTITSPIVEPFTDLRLRTPIRTSRRAMSSRRDRSCAWWKR